eukprot:366119-Chlamydomonas_euryale.AAC.46
MQSSAAVPLSSLHSAMLRLRADTDPFVPDALTDAALYALLSRLHAASRRSVMPFVAKLLLRPARLQLAATRSAPSSGATAAQTPRQRLCAGSITSRCRWSR